MKVTKNSPEVQERKLMALIDYQGGVYFKHFGTSSRYLGSGSIAQHPCNSLEKLASLDAALVKVYEGESITITF